MTIMLLPLFSSRVMYLSAYLVDFSHVLAYLNTVCHFPCPLRAFLLPTTALSLRRFPIHMSHSTPLNFLRKQPDFVSVSCIFSSPQYYQRVSIFTPLVRFLSAAYFIDLFCLSMPDPYLVMSNQNPLHGRTDNVPWREPSSDIAPFPHSSSEDPAIWLRLASFHPDCSNNLIPEQSTVPASATSHAVGAISPWRTENVEPGILQDSPERDCPEENREPNKKKENRATL